MKMIVPLLFLCALSQYSLAQNNYQVLDLLYDDYYSLRIDGEKYGDKIGLSVAAGDINGDGYDDMVIGANEADNRRGAVYVIMGAPGLRNDSEIDLVDADDRVVKIQGNEDGDQLGNWVVCCDIDGDGYDDMVLPALHGDTAYGTDTGKAYVLRGSSAFPNENVFNVEQYQGGLTQLHGVYQYGTLGFIDSSGDLNGDGCADIILKSHLADPLGRSDAGVTYVVFGQQAFFSKDLVYLTPWNDDGVLTVFGRGAHEEDGFRNSETTGWSTGAGDLNGDGYDELIIGSHNADPFGLESAGSVYVIAGSADIDSHQVIDLLNPDVPVLTIYGENYGDNAGNIVVTEDIDADGYDDLAINALKGDSYFQRDTGKIYILFGNQHFLDTNTISLGNNPMPAISLSGYRSGDGLGPMGFGDINGDGYRDLVAGMPFFDYHSIFDDREGSGGAALMFGGPDIRSYGDVHVSDPNLHYIVSESNNDTFGFRVATGDFNGDSIDDVLFGAHGASPNYRSAAGACYAVWGNDTWTMPDLPQVPLAADSAKPTATVLHDNYPNPFNPRTTISFTLSGPSSVKLSIFNVLGTEVDVLEEGHLSAGQFSYEWNAERYASGIYFCRLQTDMNRMTKRMILLK